MVLLTSWSRTASINNDVKSRSPSSRPIAPLAALAFLEDRSFSILTFSSRSLRLAAALAAFSALEDASAVFDVDEVARVTRCALKRDSRNEEEGTASYLGSETNRVLTCNIKIEYQVRCNCEERERLVYLGPFISSSDTIVFPQHLTKSLLP